MTRVRHAYIHEYHVGQQCSRHLDRFLAVSGGPEDFNIGSANIENDLQTLDKQYLIVGQ